MKTTAARASEIVAWLAADRRDAREAVQHVAENLRGFLHQELLAVLLAVDARAADARDDRERVALRLARDVLKEIVDPRVMPPDAGPYVMLDCATCARLGKYNVPLDCVGAGATDMAWTRVLDGDHRTHDHDPNRRELVFRCAHGHELVVRGKVRCWCGWQGEGPS